MADDKTQADKFKEAAREHEADEDEARWEERLRKIATRNPDADDLTPEGEQPANH